MKSLDCKCMIIKDGRCIHHVDAYTPTDAGFCTMDNRFRCIEDLKYSLPSISHSAVLAWISCKMYYKYFYILGLRCRNSYLPVEMKRGKVWDLFMNGMNTNGEPDYAAVNSLVEELDLPEKDMIQLNALTLAYRDLEIKSSTGYEQAKFAIPIHKTTVTGIIDWCTIDGFEENKLSGSPDWYLRIENIYQQIGTYFLSDESFEYADMKIARMPQLRSGFGKTRDESPEAFLKRVYDDIISKPSHYFLGYNRETRTWGKRYWRKEFDLAYLSNMYEWILQEIRDTVDRDSFYRNDNSCFKFMDRPCIYHNIKKSGVASNIIYYRAKVKGGTEHASLYGGTSSPVEGQDDSALRKDGSGQDGDNSSDSPGTNLPAAD